MTDVPPGGDEEREDYFRSMSRPESLGRDAFGHGALLGIAAHSSHVEARVAKLEAHIEHIRGDIADIKHDGNSVSQTLGEINVKIATMDSELKHKPGKGYVVTVAVLLVTAIAALIEVGPFLQAYLAHPTVTGQ